MKKLLLFLCSVLCPLQQAMTFRVYNAHPTRSVVLEGPAPSQPLTLIPKAVSQYIRGIFGRTGPWRYHLTDMPAKMFDLTVSGVKDPVIVIEPVADNLNALKDAYVITYDAWQARFRPAEQKEQKAVASGDIPKFIAIRLIDGSSVQFNTEDDDIFESETFKKLIADQFAKNDSFILARVLNEEGQAYYFDAHSFNKSLFKKFDLRTVPVDLPPEPGSGMATARTFGVESVTEDVYLKYGTAVDYPKIFEFQKLPGLYNRNDDQYNYLNYYKLPDGNKVNTYVGVQYFVLRPGKVADGFQYLCSYTPAKGFNNNILNSPYRGQPQSFFMDYFYANQNGDLKALKDLKGQSIARIGFFERRIKEEAEARARELKEQAEKEAKAAAAQITIYLPDGKKEELAVSENEAYAALSSFQELMDDQKAKNDQFMLARVVDVQGRVYYFDAHAFNQDFFSDKSYGAYNKFFQRGKNTMAPNMGKYFEVYKIPTNNQKINDTIGVQYFIYDPRVPQNGFQYFATYTKPRGFYNDIAGSPYRGRSQDFFIDYFYANQNELGLEKLKEDAKKRLPQLPAPAPIASSAPTAGEQKAIAGDLAVLTDDKLEDRAFDNYIQFKIVEAIRLFEELYRRVSSKQDEQSRRDKLRYANYLAGLYFNGGNGVAPNYEKAKLYYTEVLQDASPFNRAQAKNRLQEIAAIQQSPSASEKINAAQQGYETDLKAARDLYAAGDQNFNYLRAIEKLLPIFNNRLAPEAIHNEAAFLLGEIYFKGGRSVEPNNTKAAEYFQSIMSGPFYDRAQDNLLQIAAALSIQSAAQPLQPRPSHRPEVKADAAAAAAEAARRQAEADRKLQEDADLAAAIAASLQPQQQPRPASQAEQKAGRQPEQPVYPEEAKEREAQQQEEQRVSVNVSNDLILLHNSLLALHAAVR